MIFLKTANNVKVNLFSIHCVIAGNIQTGKLAIECAERRLYITPNILSSAWSICDHHCQISAGGSYLFADIMNSTFVKQQELVEINVL